MSAHEAWTRVTAFPGMPQTYSASGEYSRCGAAPPGATPPGAAEDKVAGGSATGSLQGTRCSMSGTCLAGDLALTSSD